jgi:hypothetical protein
MLLRTASVIWANDWGITVYSVALSLLYVRFMRLYAGSALLGPKLLILKRMGNDLISFLMMFVIFLLAFGTVSAAILTPDEMSSVWVQDILYRPTMILFGEFFHSEYYQEMSQLGGFTQLVLVFLVGAYIIATNLVLMNVLTAMFASSYQDVDSQAQQYWHFLFFDLLEEYTNRPLMPGMLAYFEVILELNPPWLPGWARNICTACAPTPRLPAPRFDRQTRIHLEHFQELHTDEFLEARAAARDADQDNAIKITRRLCVKMWSHMRELHSHLPALMAGNEDQAAAQVGIAGDIAAPHTKVAHSLAAVEYPTYERAVLSVFSMRHCEDSMKELFRQPSAPFQLHTGEKVMVKKLAVQALSGALIACFEAEAVLGSRERIDPFKTYGPDGQVCCCYLLGC